MTALQRYATAALLCTSCLELSLPEKPPPPGPGTVQGTLVYSAPGRVGLLPGRGGRVALLGSSNEVRADDEGRFVFTGVTSSRGTLRLSLDLDGDGAPDRQRLLPLAAIGAEAGRDVSLGDVVLGRNARLTGRVVRDDLPGDAFHVGTTVFVTGMEYSTFSADNGSFALEALPEGPLQVAFFRANYLPDSRDVVLEQGEEKTLALVRLRASPSEAAFVSGVVQSLAAPVAGARVRAVAPEGESTASSDGEGRFRLGPVPAGAFLIGVEKEGFVSASLGRQLLMPGANDLGIITLSAGSSQPLDLDAGPPPPRPDGGSSSGDGGSSSGDGGSSSGDGGSSTGDGGSSSGDGGSSSGDGGSSGGGDGGADGGSDAGIDAGAPLDCRGACAPGFFCSPAVECQTTACGLTSCAGPCNDGRCYARSCGAVTCGIGEVCEGVTCRPLACAGVPCPSGTLCANGRCLSQLCRYGTCGGNAVCVGSECVAPSCVDVLCPPLHTCVGGTCLPTTSQTGTPCAPGFVFLGGRCVDQACQGVTCPAGALCRNGQCNSTGLYVAGLTYPEGRTNLASETVIATLGPSGWRRINVTALPPVIQLLSSANGQWLFALTDDVPNSGEPEGSLWRSADGVGWVRVFDGTDRANTGAAIGAAVDFSSQSLFLGINGGTFNTLAGAWRSDDDGATWRRVVYPGTDAVGGRGRVTGVSPALTVIPNGNNGNQPGLYPNDGGARLSYFFPNDVRLLSDSSGQAPVLVSAGDLRLVDGGLLGPLTAACHDCAVFGPGSSLFVASSTAVWFSPDFGGSFGIRALPITPTVALSGLARTADDRIVVGNRNAQPPLLSSADEGLSWDQLGADWYASPDLADPVPAWQPDASYAFQQRVRPTIPNGWVFERTTGGATFSGRVEPTWPTDGGSTSDPQVSMNWRAVGPHLGLRVTALLSLRCSAGQQRCGTACVDITTNASHCGGCGLSCAGTCQAGRCELLDAGVGPQPGCADGTREGFIDEVAWPDVAACKGTWSGDLSAAADVLCGAGFHVCTEQDTEPRAVRFLDALAFPGCFAYRASNDGFDGCEPLECQGNPDRDDMAGMGRGCLLVSGVSWAPAQVPDGGASCLADRGRIDSQCCAGSVTVPGSTRLPGCRQRGEDGVVCCRD